MYGKLENGILTVVSYIDLPNGGRIIGISKDMAKELGLKRLLNFDKPTYKHTERYIETVDTITIEYDVIKNIFNGEEYKIEIKQTLYDNANMLKVYPSMAMYGSILPCVITPEFTYLYCNYLNDIDKLVLLEFNAEIL
jgi:hypothetical protein